MPHKLTLSLLLISALFSVMQPGSLTAQTIIPKGKAVHVDGILKDREWDDARELCFETNTQIQARALLKHDGEQLLLAFLMEGTKTRDSLFAIPELLLDTRHNGGEELRDDDYWFHVSAQDCYARGKRDDYSGCRADITSWRASPNLPFQGQGYEAVDSFEISIPLSLVDLSVGQDLGICLSMLLVSPERRLNLPQSADIDVPATWEHFRLEPSPGAGEMEAAHHAQIKATIESTIGWAATKDTALLYRIIADDAAYLEVHPGERVVRGIDQFKEAENFWLDPRFRHVGFETRDMQIKVSADGSVAWFYCVLDDLNSWEGREINWENTRWTGVLEKRKGGWRMVQMHFSKAEYPSNE